MADRFFVESPITADVAVLRGAESHHLAHVLRAQAGAEVILFDGSGAEFLARVTSVKKAAVELAIIERRDLTRELPCEIVLYVALPKGERQHWLVEKATELGATALVPLMTERGVAQPTDSALERLRRWVIEATKQCGRNRLLDVREPQSLAQLTATAPERCRVVAHVGTNASLAEVLESYRAANSAEPQAHALDVAIGPEGGFTAAEVELLKRGNWQVVSLGAAVLRVETAALAALSVAASRLGNRGASG